MKHKNIIPNYVSSWTDKYFHQSTFEPPIAYPSQRVIDFLIQFKRLNKVKLYRGINSCNRIDDQITSWTYDIDIARRYAKEKSGKIICSQFSPEQILLDTTVLSCNERKLLGYDYEIDDREVIVF